ncbi:hypothetical protein V6S67_03590 [Arthrobacter sp. Soc17.1.1.1]|uniref:hypothetical protein n=1 Tax=Arthrobacter sp. Soc17.1.1.1 TaxID=3121277 RepID=UPI002FE4CCF2
MLALETEEILQVCKTTTHALGNVKRSQISSVHSIRDWHAPFATMHVLHFITEHLGKLPTWEEFRAAAQQPPFSDMTWTPARDAIKEAIRRGSAPDDARGAMRWRIGNFYYSFLREQYVQAVLRDIGVPVRQHPLADALFRVDCWAGDTNIDLYIGNPLYRKEKEGRKLQARRFLNDSRPPFRTCGLELCTQHIFGEVHLPGRDVIQRAAEQISQQRRQ